MPPRGIPAAVRRELDARFQEQNELLERIMRRLEALDNQAPASPEPAEVAAAKDEAPALGEPALGAQRQDPVHPEGPAVLAAVPQVGEPVYERFRRQKPPMFSGSPDPAEAEDEECGQGLEPLKRRWNSSGSISRIIVGILNQHWYFGRRACNG